MSDNQAILNIPGYGRVIEVMAKYDYKADKCLCPVCGDVGIPWNGWFRCSVCPAIALVDGGRTFLPAPPSHNLHEGTDDGV